jgi:hypothetical protein
MGFFDLLSLNESRHWRRLLFHWPVHHASTCLRPLAPRPLRRFVATTDALTPAPAVLRSRLITAHEHRSLSRSRSPCFTYQHFQPFRLQSPSRPRHRFTRGCRLSARYPSAHRASLERSIAPSRVWASPLLGRLATVSGRIEFTCVSDWSFTSSCSPPGLTATQLLSVTGWRTLCPERTCTSRCWYAHRRT